MHDHHYYMQQALALAKEAALEGEVPVGCVIVRGDEIVGRGRNRRETAKTALGHAELEAIADACAQLGGWRLWECTLYVTLEPCPMCAGAIINARIPRVVYGAADQKAGSCGSVCDLFSMNYNHHPTVLSGVCAEEAAALLSDFFQLLRVTLRTRPKWKPRQPVSSQEEIHEQKQPNTANHSSGCSCSDHAAADLQLGAGG